MKFHCNSLVCWHCINYLCILYIYKILKKKKRKSFYNDDNLLCLGSLKNDNNLKLGIHTLRYRS
jgi:hypothetical protein